MTHDAQAARATLDLITGAWRTQATYAAATLRLPDLIASGTTDSAALAEATGADPDIVHRLMRLLVLLDVFDGDDGEGYRNTPVGDLLRDRPDSLRDLCLLYGEEFYQAWGHAGHTFATATPGFEKAYGHSLIAYLRGDDEAAGRFQRAMRASNFFFDEVPRTFDFTGNPLVIDVGGGSGQLLSTVLAAVPDARGVLVDLPHTVPIARDHLATTVGLDRADLVAQDMFEEPLPAGGDVYLLSRVLGDWDDDACVRLLANIRAAMNDGSRLLVLERVARDDGTGLLAALWDLHLLVMNGGRQRTLDDYRSLFARSGLAIDRVADLPMDTSGLVMSPAP